MVIAEQVSRRNYPAWQRSPRATMTSLSFSDLVVRLGKWSFPERIEVVVGIASGGVVPAALVAMRLGVDLRLIALNYRDDANEPRYDQPRLISRVPELGAWRRILLVDDVYVSGRSWHAARSLLGPDVEVLPFVMKGQVDFALIRDVEGCVQWPWKVQ
jgi:adenine/guanine phosphoribosyltransferase-like PRPP-binding protein